MFPVLYACSSTRNASIASCLTSSSVGEGRAWHITFIWDFNDWEVEEVLAFLTFIHSKIPTSVDPDVIWRKLRLHGVFDAKSFYHALAGTNDIKFPWKAIWRIKAPRRVSFFMRSTAWEKILTCDNLMRQGFTMVGWCCMWAMLGKPEAIFWSTVPLLQIYGTRCYVPLGFFGCSPIILLIFFLVGIIILGNTTLRFRIWCLYA